MFQGNKFEGKKFVLVLSGNIAAPDLAYAGALLGLGLGRKVPEMVGRDQKIPGIPGQSETTTHHGITTQNLPVLNGRDYANMRSLKEKFQAHPELIIVDVTDAVATSPTYADYAKTLNNTSATEINYWGIAVFGDAQLISECTQGLKLYGDQPKAKETEVKFPAQRLTSDIDLALGFMLVNNLSGGKLANAGAILGVTNGKLLSEKIFGADIADKDGNIHAGLPQIDLRICNGHSDKHEMMPALRQKLHQVPEMELVVDVSDVTGSTRSYDDYLAIVENTPLSKSKYWGIGICGSKDTVAGFTEEAGAYMTSAQEQALIKKQAAEQKWAAKKKSPASAEGVPSSNGWYAKTANAASEVKIDASATHEQTTSLNIQ